MNAFGSVSLHRKLRARRARYDQHKTGHRRRVGRRVVGVIASPAALARATRLRRPPDLFEFRLDALRRFVRRSGARCSRSCALRSSSPRAIRRKAAAAMLDRAARRALLARFLGHAAFVDLELRSAPANEGAARRKCAGAESAHHFPRTTSVDTPQPDELLRQAKLPRPAQAPRFSRSPPAPTRRRSWSGSFRFFRDEPARALPIAAMGDRKTRPRLPPPASRGSVRPHLCLARRSTTVPGQPSLRQLRRARRAYGVY